MKRPHVGALILVLLCARSFAAFGQTCSGCIFLNCHTPAVSVPNQFWGELQPADNGILPLGRDSTSLADYGNPEFTPRWVSLDPVTDGSGSWLFALTNYRIQTWRLTNPDAPTSVMDLAFSQSGIEAVVDAHTAQVFSSIKTAPGSSNQIAVGGTEGVGVAVFNTTNKMSPSLRYQDRSKDAYEVYTARLGNRDYLFAAGNLGGEGVRVYDLTTIAGLNSTCYETTPSSILCGTSHVGPIGPPLVHRASGIHGVGNFVAFSAPLFDSPGGVFIYNVSSPAAPVQVLQGLEGIGVNDVAMWQEGSSYYLAVRLFNSARIYDVTCIANGGCLLGNPIWSQTVTNSVIPRVTFSRSGSTPMLYWSTQLACSNGNTGEMLQDVSTPTAPRALVDPSYWRYYHWDTATGFNYLAPYEGKFLDDRFYRAAFAVLDVHRWGAAPLQPPAVSSVSASPNPASVCQPVTFTANGVTGGSGATYTWQVRDAVTNALVPGSGTVGVDLNPFQWNTSSATPGSYKGWVLLENSAGQSLPVASDAVTVNGLTALPGAGTFAPTKVVDNSGAVKFNVAASGATEWSWDFGDSGGAFGAWSSDPVNGPSPTHVYTSSGSKTVRVQVRNCAAGPVASANLVIDVPVVNPLVANFAFQSCAGGFGAGGGGSCTAPTTVSFTDLSTGAELWDYDWDCKQNGSGCGSFEEAGNTSPVASHYYSSAGNYTPKLRVRRGASEENVFTHSVISIAGTTCGNFVCESGETSSSCPVDCGSTPTPTPPPPTASLLISGPTSGLTGVPNNYTASASNCTPAANGWNWSHDGSAAATTTNSISIQWSTAGTKSISVTNSGCPGIFDSHTVTISTGAGQLIAAYTTQINGLTVSFNATASQGSPTSFLWNFGDGQTGSGMTTQHTYATAGSYTVVLSVSRQDPNCTFGLCNAEKSSVVQVGGGGTPTPTPTPTPPDGLCQADADTFCALGGDFKVEVNWEKKNGVTGVGRLVADATSDSTGVFYFFDTSNWELLLKVLDGCAVNDHYWVFGGAATNVKYHIRVTDLVTDDVWDYENPQGKSSDAITDTLAFDTCNVNRSLMRANAVAAAADELEPRVNPFDPNNQTPTPTATATPTPTPTPSATPANVGPCDPNATTLCALSERFRVRVHWQKKNGSSGDGTVVPTVTDNTGLFWFFEQENWELLIKVLDGCSINQRYWVFGAGATNVNYVVTVDDLQTGATWEYENAQGHASPAITDTAAFDTCP